MNSFILLFVLGFSVANSQTLHHQAISSFGSSSITLSDLYVNQTIGQQSNLGTVSRKGFVVQQGFQQSMFSKSNNSKNNLLQVTMYPNPVRSVLNFDFSNVLNESISISIYDMSGKLIFNDRKIINSNKLICNSLEYLPVGNYIVSLEGSSLKFSSKFLKIY